MKTKKEIQEKLKALKEDYREVKERFIEHDNHEDLQDLIELESAIEILEWVLHN